MTPRSSLPSTSNFTIPSLDGIRAIAVGLVFFAHSGLEKLVPGGLGVTIFFVLSGYLISTLLRIEYASAGKVSYRRFYLRRFLRLMPPLFVVIGFTLILAALSVTDKFTIGGLLSVLFYYGNYFVIAHDFHGVPAGVSVVWSLAVEEHYYFIYPPLAALLLRVGKIGVSAAALTTLCIAVLAWRCWLALHGASEDYIAMATDTRIDAILIGCLLALLCNPWLDSGRSDANLGANLHSEPRVNRVRDVALIVGSLALLLFTLVYRDDFFRMTYRYLLQSVAVAVLLYFAVARAHAWPFRWLNNPVLKYVGVISYTVYLSHHIIMQILVKYWPAMNWFASTAIAAALTLAVAEPMRRFIEEPCARLRKRLHRQSSRSDRPAAEGAARGTVAETMARGTL